jgi:hypothetical protein
LTHSRPATLLNSKNREFLQIFNQCETNKKALTKLSRLLESYLCRNNNDYVAYFFLELASILSFNACKASLASPKVGLDSSALAACLLTAAFTLRFSSSLKIAV